MLAETLGHDTSNELLDWFATEAERFVVSRIQEAMEDLGVGLAVELGYESFYEPAADDHCPSDDDIAHALREPVSMGAVLNDLCRLLGIAPPALVAMALDG